MFNISSCKKLYTPIFTFTPVFMGVPLISPDFENINEFLGEMFEMIFRPSFDQAENDESKKLWKQAQCLSFQ